MINLVVLISGGGTNLQALIDGCQDGRIGNAKIAAVISNKDGVFGLERARQAGIPALTINHRDFASREDFDQALAKKIDQYQPNLVVLAGFMRILTAAFTDRYAGRMLNIHPSLLPKYPGLHTHQRALDAGDNEHGVTVHFVTSELDCGPHVIQARVPVLEGDDADALAGRVLQQEHIIYPMAVDWFARGRLKMNANRALLDGRPLPSAGYQISAANQD